MPHRNRTLIMVTTLICVFALIATLVSAAVRSGGDSHQHRAGPGASAMHSGDGGEAHVSHAGQHDIGEADEGHAGHGH